MRLPKPPMESDWAAPEKRLPKTTPRPQEPALEPLPAARLVFGVAGGIWSRFANYQDTATLWIMSPSMAVCSWPHINGSSDYRNICYGLKTGRLGHKQCGNRV